MNEQKDDIYLDTKSNKKLEKKKGYSPPTLVKIGAMKKVTLADASGIPGDSNIAFPFTYI